MIEEVTLNVRGIDSEEKGDSTNLGSKKDHCFYSQLMIQDGQKYHHTISVGGELVFNLFGMSVYNQISPQELSPICGRSRSLSV